MTFNSISFLIFFPVVTLAYFLIPCRARRARKMWLLAASYFFYMSWNPRYVVLILTSTLITWVGGRLIGRIRAGEQNGAVRTGHAAGAEAARTERAAGAGADRTEQTSGAGAEDDAASRAHRAADRRCRRVLAAGLTANLLILAFFKYYGFLAQNLEAVLARFGFGVRVPAFDVLLPVGISFYTFQALGYLIDVYRGTIAPEKNLFDYALFVSFFPQLVAGPIERSRNLIRQIHEDHPFDADRARRGLLLMMWGFYKKLVIADRAALLVTEIYDNYMNYTGLQILLATMVFAVQIYCDFSGYSDIAVGAAQVLGFDLMENFRTPYFSVSVAGFWRNWHISLTTWFRDYVYIPLGGNRCGRWKKYRNILITFGLSGLWHGASWNYVAWGLLNGLYQITGDLTGGIRGKLRSLLHIRTDRFSYRLWQGIWTFFFVDAAWLLFRADGIRSAAAMVRHGMESFGPLSWLDTENVLGLNTLSLDEKDFYVLLIAIVILIAVELWHRKTSVRSALLRQNALFRWIVIYGAVFFILIFGIYGPEYDAASFIYFQF